MAVAQTKTKFKSNISGSSTDIYSSNTTSNWTFKGQSQWECGDQVLIAAMWYLGKGKRKRRASNTLDCDSVQ